MNIFAARFRSIAVTLRADPRQLHQLHIMLGDVISMREHAGHVAWADVVMGRHDQMRQKKLLRNGRRGGLTQTDCRTKII
jgi:hypothetical protein